MKAALASLAAAVLMSPSPSAMAAEPTHPSLRVELLQMKERDQAARRSTAQKDFRNSVEVDFANRRRLKEIVEQQGWPTIAMVGEDGAHAAWLLAQHAGQDPQFQRKALGLMEALLKDGQVSAKDYAYLYDNTHYPQRYGTRGSCVSAEEWQPLEIEDIENVDARRRELGMPALADYAAMFKQVCAQNFTSFRPPSEPLRTVPLPKR